MKITFKSEDPRAMDAFVREVVVTVKEAGGSVFGPIPLPTRCEGKSPKANTYLGSLVKPSALTQRFHLRALAIDGMTPKVKSALEGLKAPGAVAISITE